MKKKIAYVVNYFTLLETENGITENTLKIDCYTSKENMKEKNFLWRFDFSHINNKNTDVKKALDNFYMSLRQLYLDGYEIKFICLGIEESD